MKTSQGVILKNLFMLLTRSKTELFACEKQETQKSLERNHVGSSFEPRGGSITLSLRRTPYRPG